jgi:outer membrane protein OmpA-like peptidoglycan-associated protein
MQLARITQGLARAKGAQKGAIIILVMSIVGLSGCSVLKTDDSNKGKVDLVLFDINSESVDNIVFCGLGSKDNWACPSVTKKTPVKLTVVEEKEQVFVEEIKPKHFDNILFDFNKSQLTNVAKVKLISYLPVLAGNQIILNGYTDDVGGDNYNKNLAQERAESVKNFLMQYGMVSSQMETNGLGECCFLMPNDDDKSRSVNRRVEIYIKEQSQRK